MSLYNRIQDIQAKVPEFLVATSSFSFKIRNFDDELRQATETAKISFPEIDSLW